jgi:hypothetical protein
MKYKPSQLKAFYVVADGYGHITDQDYTSSFDATCAAVELHKKLESDVLILRAIKCITTAPVAIHILDLLNNTDTIWEKEE